MSAPRFGPPFVTTGRARRLAASPIAPTIGAARPSPRAKVPAIASRPLLPLHRFRLARRRGLAPGFTMIEMMMVVAVIAVLALLAVPGISDRVVRDQVVEASKLIEFTKPPIQAAWSARAAMPVDNAAAGLPPATSIVSNVVSSVAIESGAIQVTFGNQANGALRGKILSFRPGVVEASPIVPIAWVCGHASPPVPMNARGLDKTSVPDRYLPLNCRAPARASAP